MDSSPPSRTATLKPDWKISTRTCRWCHRPFVRPPNWPWLCYTPECFARCDAYSIKTSTGDYFYLPLPLQAAIMEAVAPATELEDQITHVLVGGAAGASKSHGGRFGAYWWAMRIPKCRILLLREVSDELIRSHILGLMDVEAPALGAHFVMHPHPIARWPNGSFIEGGHMEDATSVKRYLSSEYDLIIAEESSLYDPDALMELTTRARTTNPAMRKMGGARVWFPTNPGGPATDVLRELFIEQTVSRDEWPSLAAEYRPHEWISVRGLLDDNPYMDASYERRLTVLRQQWRYQQLRFGDWYAAPGLFFDKFLPATHVRDLDLAQPDALSWFRSCDWGYHDPGVMLWWVVLDDRHCHIAAELKFREQTPEQLASRIEAIDAELGIHRIRTEIRTHASPDMWGRRGQVGEFLYESARRCGWPVQQANTDRENGWMRLQAMFYGNGTVPYITMASRCRYLIKSFQKAQSDKSNPNDVAGDDDHALEAARYGAMSRPGRGWSPPVPRRGEWDADFAPPEPIRIGASTKY